MPGIIWIITAFGALIGVLPVVDSSAPTMIVGGFVGAGFGAPIGAAIAVLVMTVKRMSRIGTAGGVGKSRKQSQTAGAHYSLMMTADEWKEYRARFPFYAAGDTDPIAKTMTGWTDVSDIHYGRDITP